MCVRALDPGSRALLDLSLRRRMPFEAMAGVLHTDPFDLARRRARAVARIAAELDLEGAGVVAAVKAALARLPDDAWCVPVAPVEPKSEPEPAVVQEEVQAEAMAEAARALMEKLRDARERVRETEPDPCEQPTVESEAIVLPPQPQPWKPVAATPMAAAFSHHPAFAVEMEQKPDAELPPLAVALAQAAADEREAAEARGAEMETETDGSDQPTIETEAIRTRVREPRRRLARGGLIIGLLLAVLRLLFGRD